MVLSFFDVGSAGICHKAWDFPGSAASQMKAAGFSFFRLFGRERHLSLSAFPGAVRNNSFCLHRIYAFTKWFHIPYLLQFPNKVSIPIIIIIPIPGMRKFYCRGIAGERRWAWNRNPLSDFSLCFFLYPQGPQTMTCSQTPPDSWFYKYSCVCFVCSCFLRTVAELSSNCNECCVALRSYNIYYLVLFRKRLPTPDGFWS